MVVVQFFKCSCDKVLDIEDDECLFKLINGDLGHLSLIILYCAKP